jgi:lipase chaperone LimK
VKRTRVGAAALAAALAVGLWWWIGVPAPAPGGRSATDTTTGTGAAATAASSAASPAATASAADPLATGSLRGTAVDGDVRFDAGGALVLDAELRRLFDYHLSLIGELDLRGIRERLRQTLAARLDPARVEIVLAHFDRYTDYLNALPRSAVAAESDPARRLDALRRLRRERLGEAMATGFFAEEEALAELTVRRMAIAEDPTLDADRKREALAALDREAGYTARAAAELPALAESIERSARTAADRDAARRAQWGEDAAQRLAALDAERADWEARVRRYAAARARIDADAGLDANARARAIAALRAQMFDANEQRRIASLEAIGRLDATLSP